MKIILLILLSAITFPCFAQTEMKGEIRDELGHLVDVATVTITQNKKPVKYAISENGKFIFDKIIPGEYNIAVTKVGYTSFSRNISLPKDSILIYIKENVTSLKVVTVLATKPLIERKIDRIVFNVENSIIASAGTAWDALTRAPGVQTQASGAITAQNKSVIVYLDDRPIRMAGDDLANYLKSLPSDKISQIEVISNPPAKYDAQGAAIINIVSKKPIGDGFNLTLGSGYTQTTYANYTGSFLFNYRTGPLNVYGNYGYSKRKKDHEETDYVIFNSPERFSDWETTHEGYRGGNSNNFQLGTDISLNKKQVLGFLVNGYYGNNNRRNQSLANIFNNHNTTPDSAINTDNLTNGHSIQYSYNLNYKAKLDTNGQSLNIDVDYVPFRNKNNQLVNSETFLSEQNESVNPYNTLSNSDQRLNIWSGKVDYGKTIFKKLNFSAGVKYTNIDSKNIFDFFNQGSLISLSNQYDNFEYKERTIAGYINVNGRVDNLSYQVGFRGEQTRTTGDSKTMDTINTQSYFHLFPSVYLSYALSKDHELNIVYASRINRPDYSRLNPFKYYTGPYTYYEGNPELKPAYVHNYEFGYTYKKQYNITLFYRRTTDVFSNITVQDNTSQIFYNTQQNLGLSSEKGLFASVPVTVTNWWQMNNFVQASIKQEKSAYLDGTYNYHKPSIYVNTNQSFTLNKKAGFRAEVSAWYSSPSIQGIYKLNETYDVSFGLRKSLFNGQGAVRLAISDIFYGNAYRINVAYLNQQNGFYEKNDTRSASLSISYRLGSSKVPEARKRKTASEDEQKRGYN